MFFTSSSDLEFTASFIPIKNTLNLQVPVQPACPDGQNSAVTAQNSALQFFVDFRNRAFLLARIVPLE
jgi:hypothetical protein